MRLCAHCKERQGSAWFSDPDDELRAAQSQAAHAEHCMRLLPYTTQNPADLAIAKRKRNA